MCSKYDHHSKSDGQHIYIYIYIGGGVLYDHLMSTKSFHFVKG